MRKFLLATTVLIVPAGPALAADLPSPVYKASPPPAVPAWSWTGCYVGGHAGGLRSNSTEWVVRTPGNLFFGRSLGGHAASGWLAGGQAGCDYQFAGGFVIGIAGDVAAADAVGSHDSALETGVAYHSRVRSLASVTGRIGYAWNRFLGYVRGGGAWERDEYSATTVVLGTAYRSRETRSGWTVGIGGEYAFSEFLSGFVEYGYYDFGTRTISFTPQVAGLGPAFADVKETKGVVRAGLNFHFGGLAAPVVARY